MAVDETEVASVDRWRKAGPFVLAAVAIGIVWWTLSGARSMPPERAPLHPTSLHSEARIQILAAIEIYERHGGEEELAKVQGLKPAGMFDEFHASCGYRKRDHIFERVIVLDGGILHENMSGAGDVFDYIDQRIDC